MTTPATRLATDLGLTTPPLPSPPLLGLPGCLSAADTAIDALLRSTTTSTHASETVMGVLGPQLMAGRRIIVQGQHEVRASPALCLPMSVSVDP